MPKIIPIGFADAAIEIKHFLDDDPWMITHGVTVDLANGSYEDHANAVFGAFAGALGSALSGNASVVKATLTIGVDGPDPVIAESTLAPVPGQTAGEMLPQNCAMLVKKRTGLGGRRNRGRVYIPNMLREAMVDQAGGIDGAEVAAFQGGVDTWLSNLETGTGAGDPAMTMVILHTYPAVTPTPAPPTPVTQLVVDPVIATQRRRLRR